MDFQTLKSSEEARQGLVESEIRRGLQHDNNECVHYRLNKALWLHSRVGFLRSRSKSCFSQACKAGSDKKVRDELRAQATEFQREADTVLVVLQTIERSFGNIIIASDDDVLPMLSPTMIISSAFHHCSILRRNQPSQSSAHEMGVSSSDFAAWSCI